MTPYELIVLGLATHQAISLWFNGGLFVRLRERVSPWHPLIHEGVNCAVCMSVWCGAACVVAWAWPYGREAVWVLAIIDIAGLVQRVVR